MFDFIQRHQRIILVIMGGVLLAMMVILFFVGRNTNKQSNTNQNSNTVNSLDYSYLKQYPDQVDQNILLKAHIAGEEYGSYSGSDISSLNDLLAQSTANFQPTVQSLIDTIPGSSADVSTTADPNSFNLDKASDTSATVTMNAKRTANGQITDIKIIVKLVKQQTYWLIDKIDVQNQ